MTVIQFISSFIIWTNCICSTFIIWKHLFRIRMTRWQFISSCWLQYCTVVPMLGREIEWIWSIIQYYPVIFIIQYYPVLLSSKSPVDLRVIHLGNPTQDVQVQIYIMIWYTIWYDYRYSFTIYEYTYYLSHIENICMLSIQCGLHASMQHASCSLRPAACGMLWQPHCDKRSVEWGRSSDSYLKPIHGSVIQWSF